MAALPAHPPTRLPSPLRPPHLLPSPPYHPTPLPSPFTHPPAPLKQPGLFSIYAAIGKSCPVVCPDQTTSPLLLLQLTTACHTYLPLAPLSQACHADTSACCFPSAGPAESNVCILRRYGATAPPEHQPGDLLLPGNPKLRVGQLKPHVRYRGQGAVHCDTVTQTFLYKHAPALTGHCYTALALAT